MHKHRFQGFAAAIIALVAIVGFVQIRLQAFSLPNTALAIEPQGAAGTSLQGNSLNSTPTLSFTYGTDWTASYYNNSTLSGSPVLIEAPAGGLNFNWGFSSPRPGVVNLDHFSARFTSVQAFYAAPYEFFPSSDDGVRVFIDGVLVWDRFINRSLGSDYFQKTMTEGNHTVVVEYFDNVARAELHFMWVPSPLVSGFVRDNDRVTPIAGAKVDVFGYTYLGSYVGSMGSTTTLADGSYSLRVPVGYYRLYASADSYVSEFWNEQPNAEKANYLGLTDGYPRVQINFTLYKPATINGIVTETDGITPIAGVLVGTYGYTYEGSYVGAMGSTVTEADGTYTLTVPEGRIRVGASRYGYEPEFYSEQQTIDNAQPLDLEGGSTTDHIDFTLTAFGTIEGTVYQPDGVTPLVGALVGCFPDGYIGSYAGAFDSTTTDENGHFIFHLPPGNYRFGVLPQGGGSGFNTLDTSVPWYFDGKSSLADADLITVKNGDQFKEMDVIYGGSAVKAALDGDLTLQTANPSIHVVITPSAGGDAVYDDLLTTDIDGDFVVPFLTPGDYRVWVKGTHALANAQTVTLVVGDNAVPLGTLLEGDADGDNIINILDFSILASAFSKSEGQLGYNTNADFNGDHIVNIHDFSLLAANFSKSGAAP